LYLSAGRLGEARHEVHPARVGVRSKLSFDERLQLGLEFVAADRRIGIPPRINPRTRLMLIAVPPIGGISPGLQPRAQGVDRIPPRRVRDRIACVAAAMATPIPVRLSVDIDRIMPMGGCR
jgi:hypothetical protein